jgi:hypothetical protein
MMGYREVARCARCGTLVDAQILTRSTCPKCQQELRACVQCTHFDPGARFECVRPVPNDCALFEARTSWERETTTAGSAPPAPGSSQSSAAPSTSARKAFDDLFKF